jgi:hypothetical protein
MAKYQNMLVAIDPNQDDQPALRRAVYLHQRIGGKIKAFLPIYDFSYEMTTFCRLTSAPLCVRASSASVPRGSANRRILPGSGRSY